MSPQRRQRLLLGVLVLVAAVAGGRWLLGWLGAEGTIGRAQRVDFERALATEVAALDTDALYGSSGEYSPGRDPWQFYRPPAPVPAVVERPEPRSLPEPVELSEPVEVEPPRPRPPPIDVEYHGVFGPERRRIAVLSDGPTLINAFVGDELKGKFRLEAIGVESVKLSFLGFPETPPATLAISEMKTR